MRLMERTPASYGLTICPDFSGSPAARDPSGPFLLGRCCDVTAATKEERPRWKPAVARPGVAGSAAGAARLLAAAGDSASYSPVRLMERKIR